MRDHAHLQGWVLMSDPGTGQQSCEDLNECQATSIMQSHANCSCDRCACINTIGSFKCVTWDQGGREGV